MESIADLIEKKIDEALKAGFRIALDEPCQECADKQERINCKDAEIAELKIQFEQVKARSAL